MFPWNMFPFNKDMKGPLQGMKPHDIEKHIQEMMNKMFTEGMQGMNNQGAPWMNAQPGTEYEPPNPNGSFSMHNDSHSSTVFETHDFVFARIPIKEEDWLKKIKVYHTSNQLIIEHLPGASDKRVYTLPSTVKKKGATAHYKDGVLEVRIPKNIDLQFSEIDVTEIM